MHIVIIPIVLIWSYISRRWQAAKARQLVAEVTATREPITITA